MSDTLAHRTVEALMLIGNITRESGQQTVDLASYNWRQTLRKRLTLSIDELGKAEKQLFEEGLIRNVKGPAIAYISLTEKGTEAYQAYKGIEPQEPSFLDRVKTLPVLKKYFSKQ